MKILIPLNLARPMVGKPPDPVSASPTLHDRYVPTLGSFFLLTELTSGLAACPESTYLSPLTQPGQVLTSYFWSLKSKYKHLSKCTRVPSYLEVLGYEKLCQHDRCETVSQCCIKLPASGVKLRPCCCHLLGHLLYCLHFKFFAHFYYLFLVLKTILL